MSRRIALAAAATVIGASASLVSAPAWAGWYGHGTAYTSRGEYNGAHGGYCSGGTCNHAGGVVGPYGGVASNSGSVTRTSPGQFSNSGTAYGPNGRSVQHSGDTSCASGTCSHTGTMTGWAGGTGRASGGERR